MRAIGPNCHGIIVPGTKLNIGFSNVITRKGKVAFISQSGALCASVLDWANEAKIGFSYFISIGNAVDVTLVNGYDGETATDGRTYLVHGKPGNNLRASLLSRLTYSGPSTAIGYTTALNWCKIYRLK